MSKDGEESARERRGRRRCGVGTGSHRPAPGTESAFVSSFYSLVQRRAARLGGRESWGLLTCGVTAGLCEWMSQLLSLSILFCWVEVMRTERVARGSTRRV